METFCHLFMMEITFLRLASMVVEEDVQEDSVCSLSSGDINTSSEPEMTKKTVPRSRNKGKEKVVEEDYDEDSERETFRSDSNNDSSYSPGDEDTVAYVKPKATHLRKKGMSKIKNPEGYLDNPENAHFETRVQTRPFELLIPRQLVRDYCLKFQNFVSYIDNHKAGELETKTVQWSEQRVCIKKWNHICERNNVKKEDAILCELLRKRNVVYAVKIHIVREKDLKKVISIVLD